LWADTIRAATNLLQVHRESSRAARSPAGKAILNHTIQQSKLFIRHIGPPVVRLPDVLGQRVHFQIHMQPVNKRMAQRPMLFVKLATLLGAC